MSKRCPKCQYFVGAPLLSSTALILLGMEFTRNAHLLCWHPLPLLHNDITELLGVRHMVIFNLSLEDAPHVLKRVQVWRHTWPLHHIHFQQQGNCHLGGVFGVAFYVGKHFKLAQLFFFLQCWNPCFPQ